MSVLHLRKTLDGRIAVPEPRNGVSIRTFGGEQDIEPWLQLRQVAFASETPSVRPWSRTDFEREFLSKSWWDPDRLWLIFTPGRRDPIGTISLILPAESPPWPSLHWLAVHPDCRGQGLGNLLIETAEHAAFQAGVRELRVETHAQWHAAVVLYRSRGYRE